MVELKVERIYFSGHCVTNLCIVSFARLGPTKC